MEFNPFSVIWGNPMSSVLFVWISGGNVLSILLAVYRFSGLIYRHIFSTVYRNLSEHFGKRSSILVCKISSQFFISFIFL